jgi:hypothetical protein
LLSARNAGPEPAEPLSPFRCRRAARRVLLSESRAASVWVSALARRTVDRGSRGNLLYVGKDFDDVLRPGAQNGTDVRTARTDCEIEQGLTGTKARIAEAALETVKARGFASARARDIARTGGFNQALLLYHFGGVHNALLGATS